MAVVRPLFQDARAGHQACQAGRVRVNRRPVQKAHHILRVGDILTFPQAGGIRVVRVEALAERRGPAPEAARLYANLDG